MPGETQEHPWEEKVLEGLAKREGEGSDSDGEEVKEKIDEKVEKAADETQAVDSAANADELKPEDAEGDESSGDESSAAPDLYDLPDDGKFLVKMDGEEVEVTGAALKNVYRQRQDLDKRFGELKTEKEGFESEKTGYEKQVDERAVNMLHAAGYIGDDGKWKISPDDIAKYSSAAKEAAAESIDKEQEAADFVELDPEKLSEDSYLPATYIEAQNANTRALKQVLANLNSKIDAVATRSEKSEQVKAEQAKEARKKAFFTSANKALEILPEAHRGDEALSDLLGHMQRDRSLTVETAAAKVKSRYEAIRGSAFEAPAEDATSKETKPPPRAPAKESATEAPPAVGGGGNATPSKAESKSVTYIGEGANDADFEALIKSKLPK